MQINPQIIVGKTVEHLAVSGEYAGVLHAEAVSCIEDLVARAKQAGFDLRIVSGFRSFEQQLAIWNAKVLGQRAVLDDRESPVDLAVLTDLEKIRAILRFSALPGASRHHWGTDFDIYDAAAGGPDYRVQLTLSETQAGGPYASLHRWLDEILPQTAFYRPYEYDLGGVAVEPWHLSYRPLSEKFSNLLTETVLIKAYHGVQMELAETIKTNMPELFKRFIQTP